MKEKIKSFIKEHEKEIKITAGVGLAVICGVTGYKLCCKVNGLEKGRYLIKDKSINFLFDDVDNKYDKEIARVAAWRDEPLKPDDLGKLGELMKSLGCDNEPRFTHFIAIGAPMEDK